MSRLAFLAALAFAALAVPAQAQRTIAIHARTAGELADLCTTSPRQSGGEAKVNYCHGFAQGMVDVEQMHGMRFCFPSGTSRDTTLAEFARWVSAEPQRRSASAVKGLTQFLTERYPCH